MIDMTVLGGLGFVGSAFCRQESDLAYVNSRTNYDVLTPDVVNFISTTHNYNVFDRPHLDIDTNLNVLIRTLESWRAHKPTGVYNFISSWFVYGRCYWRELHHIWREDEPCDPRGFYSITKRAAEQLLMSYCQTYNLKWRILRLGSVVGPDPKASKQKNAVQWMVNEIMAGRDVELYNGGWGHRHFIHVDDAATAISMIVHHLPPNQIINVGAWPAPVKDPIEFVHRRTNSKSHITSIDPPAFHGQVQTDSFIMDTDKLDMMGFLPKYEGDALWEAMMVPAST